MTFSPNSAPDSFDPNPLLMSMSSHTKYIFQQRYGILHWNGDALLEMFFTGAATTDPAVAARSIKLFNLIFSIN